MNLRKLKWITISILVLIAAFLIYAAVKIGQPATTVSLPSDFEIKKGERAGEVVDHLVAQKFVRSGLLMEIYLRLRGGESALQAGLYSLDSNMTIPEIVQILSQGKVKTSGTRLTVIEGWNITDIGRRLSDLGLTSAADFAQAAKQDYSADFAFLKTKPKSAHLEGFLFPDTYIFKTDSSADVIVRRMLDNFGRRVKSEVTYDHLILASIVEREVGRNYKTGAKLTEQDLQALQAERKLVAGVFLNRLRLGMALESDATINYITGNRDRRAKLEDLKIDSPYNTYRHRGLPPAPIANPSLDAINAVLTPTKSDYLYFLTSPDGKAYFARTLEEHKLNRAKYLEQ